MKYLLKNLACFLLLFSLLFPALQAQDDSGGGLRWGLHAGGTFYLPLGEVSVVQNDPSVVSTMSLTDVTPGAGVRLGANLYLPLGKLFGFSQELALVRSPFEVTYTYEYSDPDGTVSGTGTGTLNSLPTYLNSFSGIEICTPIPIRVGIQLGLSASLRVHDQVEGSESSSQGQNRDYSSWDDAPPLTSNLDNQVLLGPAAGVFVGFRAAKTEIRVFTRAETGLANFREGVETGRAVPMTLSVGLNVLFGD